MPTEQSNNDQFSFSAWTENQKESQGVKLHVHGEIYVSDETLLYQLDKKDPQGYFQDELFLEIKPDPTQGNNKVEVKYHEELQDSNQYKKITIFAMNEEIEKLNEITQRKINHG